MTSHIDDSGNDRDRREQEPFNRPTTEVAHAAQLALDHIFAGRVVPHETSAATEVLRKVIASLVSQFGEEDERYHAAVAMLKQRYRRPMEELLGKKVMRRSGSTLSGLGELKLIEQLSGTTTNNAIYRAETNEEVVVVVKAASDVTEESRAIRVARLMIERRVSMAGEHPNVAAVHDVGEYYLGNDPKPHLAIVEEFVDGKDLEEILRVKTPTDDASEWKLIDRAVGGIQVDESGKRSFGDRRAVEIVGVVAEALTHLLRVKSKVKKPVRIMHLDLTPMNVMIRLEPQERGDVGSVVVIDFGSASIEGRSLGGLTPGYIPPERLRNSHSQPSERWDVFNLGGLLYFLLTGDHPPSDGSTPIGRLASVDPVLLKIIQKCRAAEPVDRYSDASQVARDLRDWYFDRPVEGAGAKYTLLQRGQMLLTRARELGWWPDVSRVLGVYAVTIGLTGLLAFLYSPLMGPFNQATIDTCGKTQQAFSLLALFATICLLIPRNPNRHQRVFQDSSKWWRVLGLSVPLVFYLIAIWIVRYLVGFDRSEMALAQLLMSAMTTLLIGTLPRGLGHGSIACLALLLLAGGLAMTGALRTTVSPDYLAFADSAIQAGSQAFYFFILANYAWNTPEELRTFSRPHGEAFSSKAIDERRAEYTLGSRLAGTV